MLTPKLEAFRDLLLKWNEKINLISRSTVDFVEQVHIGDGVIGSEIIEADGEFTEIYDLGSGNGIPGLVFSVLFPHIHVRCVESDQRKAAFLKTAVITLGLKNVKVENLRVESLPRGRYVFIARGYTSIKEALAIVEKFCEKGTVFYHFKSKAWESELPVDCSTWNTHQIAEYLLEGADSVPRYIIKSVML